MKVKCNGCEHVGDESEFTKGRDFFQNDYIAGCPKCDNRQSPGDASMRAFGGDRPFVYVRPDEPEMDGSMESALDTVIHRSKEAS